MSGLAKGCLGISFVISMVKLTNIKPVVLGYGGWLAYSFGAIVDTTPYETRVNLYCIVMLAEG